MKIWNIWWWVVTVLQGLLVALLAIVLGLKYLSFQWWLYLISTNVLLVMIRLNFGDKK